MSISEDARDIKDYIIEYGWTQDAQERADGSVCLIGAARRVFDLDFQTSEFIYDRERPIREAIGKFIGLEATYIYLWNDKGRRTQEEVLSMLEDVALKHDNDEYRSGPA